jgi:quercetin dioxygenase-like cupin family protein
LPVNSRKSLEKYKNTEIPGFLEKKFFFLCFPFYHHHLLIISFLFKKKTYNNKHLHRQRLSITTTTIHSITTSASTPRAIFRAIPAVEQDEGVGARVRRSIGNMTVRNFTPFLMLDHFRIDPSAGFPDHPHRGQETITYVLKGNVDHEDFTGSKGTLGPGDLQFMTAGRGIVHAEMPCIDTEKRWKLRCS